MCCWRVRIAVVSALVAVPLTSSAAAAGWITITNDTNMVVVIQDCGDGKKGGRAKVVRLLPGETYREFQAAAGDKRMQIFEFRGPAKPLFDGPVKWKADDLSLSVQPDGKALKLAPPVVVAAPNPVKPVAHR